MISNFDERGFVILPDLFAKVVSSDAIFEWLHQLSKEALALQTRHGGWKKKRLIFAIDIKNNNKNSVRKITLDFFKDELGF
jgi:hypothetical protein